MAITLNIVVNLPRLQLRTAQGGGTDSHVNVLDVIGTTDSKSRLGA